MLILIKLIPANQCAETGGVQPMAFSPVADVTITILTDGVDVGNQPAQVYPAQPHSTVSIRGPVIVEGGQIKDRTLSPGVKLPTETDVALPVLVTITNETLQTDTLNIFNDGGASNDVGQLDYSSATNMAALAKVYGDIPIVQNTFGTISGLNMGTGLTLDFGTPGNPDVQTFSGGITYHDVEVVDTMMGRGADTFTVNRTIAVEHARRACEIEEQFHADPICEVQGHCRKCRLQLLRGLTPFGFSQQEVTLFILSPTRTTSHRQHRPGRTGH